LGTLIIGYSGRARHGKTEACEATIAAASSDGYTARLYDIGAMILRYCKEQGLLAPDIERKELNKDQLQLLIDVGKQQRSVDAEFWIGQAIRAIKEDAPDVALCPNLRYGNEAGLWRAEGGYVVRLTRLNSNGSVYISPDRPANDPSETELEFWPADFYITTKEGQERLLRQQAVTLYRYLREH